MSSLVTIDGSQADAGGQFVRAALALSAVTGTPFEMTQLRAEREPAGLRPDHLDAVRAAAMVCGARVHDAFDGSRSLRFEPGPVEPGDFRFEMGTATPATLILGTVLLPLGRAGQESRVSVTGATHVPGSPSYDYLARHWAEAVRPLGFDARLSLVRAGFSGKGGGEVRAEVRPHVAGSDFGFDQRGALVGVRGLSTSSRIRGDVAQRQRDAAQQVLWEERRLEAEWEVASLPAATPGASLLVEAVFEHGRAAFGFLGKRGVRPELMGARAARTLLRFLEGDAAVDPQLADQLAIPIAVAGGGRVTTSEVTPHLLAAAHLLRAFGYHAQTWGRPGGPGGLEVAGTP